MYVFAYLKQGRSSFIASLHKESYYAQLDAPGIDYIWDRMLDIEATENRRIDEEGGSSYSAETLSDNIRSCAYIVRIRAYAARVPIR